MVAKLYIEFSPGIGQGEMPPLFVIGLTEKTEIEPWPIVTGAAELRLGGENQQKVRDYPAKRRGGRCDGL